MDRYWPLRVAVQMQHCDLSTSPVPHPGEAGQSSNFEDLEVAAEVQTTLLTSVVLPGHYNTCRQPVTNKRRKADPWIMCMNALLYLEYPAQEVTSCFSTCVFQFP